MSNDPEGKLLKRLRNWYLSEISLISNEVELKHCLQGAAKSKKNCSLKNWFRKRLNMTISPDFVQLIWYGFCRWNLSKVCCNWPVVMYDNWMINCNWPPKLLRLRFPLSRMRWTDNGIVLKSCENKVTEIACQDHSTLIPCNKLEGTSGARVLQERRVRSHFKASNDEWGWKTTFLNLRAERCNRYWDKFNLENVNWSEALQRETVKPDLFLEVKLLWKWKQGTKSRVL